MKLYHNANICLFNGYNKFIINKPYIKNFSILAPLDKDTISFKGKNRVLKKSDFRYWDLAAIEKFKPNIQKFKSKADLQIYAQEQINIIKQKDYGARCETATKERKKILDNWFNCVCNNTTFSNTQKLIILSAITKNLKNTEDKLPPLLCTNVLANTFDDLDKRLEANPKENFDFLKMYNKRLKAEYSDSEDISTGEKWIFIPSRNNDPDNFEKNIKKLQIFSSNTWCVKDSSAKRYLSNCDAHVYIENGQPKVCLMVENGEITEIQGILNNDTIPIKYAEKIFDHMSNNQLEMCNHKLYMLEETKWELAKYKQCKMLLKDNIQLKHIDDLKKIFDTLNIAYEITPNNLIHLRKMRQASDGFTYSDLGINENNLFKYIEEIDNDVYFDEFDVTSLGNLKTIHGDGIFSKSAVTDLGKLKTIEGDARFKNSSIRDLKNLERIGCNAFFSHSKVTNVGKLKFIAGFADLRASNLTRDDFKNIEIGYNIIDTE